VRNISAVRRTSAAHETIECQTDGPQLGIPHYALGKLRCASVVPHHWGSAEGKSGTANAHQDSWAFHSIVDRTNFLNGSAVTCGG
jgi:hypothetical protein